MLYTLGADVAADLLEQRTVALEAALAAGDQVIASLTKRRLPRLNIIEIEYAQALRRAESGWVRDLVNDIRSGALPWTAANAGAEYPEEISR